MRLLRSVLSENQSFSHQKVGALCLEALTQRAQEMESNRQSIRVSLSAWGQPSSSHWSIA